MGILVVIISEAMQMDPIALMAGCKIAAQGCFRRQDILIEVYAMLGFISSKIKDLKRHSFSRARFISRQGDSGRH